MFVNDNKRNNSIHTLFYSHDSTIIITKDKCYLFADFLQSVYKQYAPLPYTIPYTLTENLFEVNDLTPSEEVLLKLMVLMAFRTLI